MSANWHRDWDISKRTVSRMLQYMLMVWILKQFLSLLGCDSDSNWLHWKEMSFRTKHDKPRIVVCVSFRCTCLLTKIYRLGLIRIRGNLFICSATYFFSQASQTLSGKPSGLIKKTFLQHYYCTWVMSRKRQPTTLQPLSTTSSDLRPPLL